MVLITIVAGADKPTYNWGAPPCISTMLQMISIYPTFPRLQGTTWDSLGDIGPPLTVTGSKATGAKGSWLQPFELGNSGSLDGMWMDISG